MLYGIYTVSIYQTLFFSNQKNLRNSYKIVTILQKTTKTVERTHSNIIEGNISTKKLQLKLTLY